jgi:hypothetical protein
MQGSGFSFLVFEKVPVLSTEYPETQIPRLGRGNFAASSLGMTKLQYPVLSTQYSEKAKASCGCRRSRRNAQGWRQTIALLRLNADR